ncbi:MAG: sigma-70 family RNA polymerase sigma factor [Rhizobacter sp.]|nr:sigma-70 family RNA polymerase sigma factor [Rhizobacter sp.]
MVRNWGALLKRVRSMLLRRGRSSEDADDLVQEAWLRLAMYTRETPVDKPGAFLARTALNLAVSADRARAVRGEEVEVEQVALADSSPGTEAAVLARERLARLDVCVSRLGGRTRAIFLDVRFGDMSYPEAARRYGISVSAVEKQMAKATMLVTRWMEGW